MPVGVGSYPPQLQVYTNMADNWKQIDPRNTEILAPTTKLQAAEAKYVLLPKVVASGGNNPDNRKVLVVPTARVSDPKTDSTSMRMTQW